MKSDSPDLQSVRSEFYLSSEYKSVCQTINKLLTDLSESSVYVQRDCGISRCEKTDGGQSLRLLKV